MPFSHFSFIPSTHHRHLHSFPTRRSSDLSSPITSNSSTAAGGSLKDRRIINLSKPLVRRFGRTLDRKSTRLNSSHLVISYAVFCLKKKNTSYVDILHEENNILTKEASSIG